MADFYWHIPTRPGSWPDSAASPPPILPWGHPCQAEPFGPGPGGDQIDAAAKHSGKGPMHRRIADWGSMRFWQSVYDQAFADFRVSHTGITPHDVYIQDAEADGNGRSP
ncbi:MAG: hypothetical protein OXC91_15675, partial [Rhodobacteraceae bacterium]|nr:hypothetical protein [Paracoccaceae bacterium]